MYRYYRRMRMELERISRIFPEARAGSHELWHAPRRSAGPADRAGRLAFAEFSLWLAICRVGYRAERLYYRKLSTTPCPACPFPIQETKCSLAITTRA